MQSSAYTRSRSRRVAVPPTSRLVAPTSSTRDALVKNSNEDASAAHATLSKSHGNTRSLSEQEGDEQEAPTSSTKYQPSKDGTKIDVFVRCRGRNEREIQEHSGVAVSTNGVRGRTIELSMGPNALSNKTYSFDGVFSQTADQHIIFDSIVTPVLDEILRGYNCTIFAYGQTGTGKTYTMSGDISDQTLLSDDAGIIPRVLHSIFLKLNSSSISPTSGTAPDNSVKISFIELYNEELRDLLSSDDKASLKMFEGDVRRGAATVVQGMEERYITSARKGIQLLRNGSHKRQVAATRYNDLSSRSHTIFTVTVYTKQTLASGEEILSSGKLNLVDLAGSENIGRSGAENKRATEAGLINKSLLTLGRVINALVDRSTHIPYRESKLTRLLQDSLGGQTKTCIITTVSPARSNLEETISSLDYAFRAKNIRNKPQINQLIPKKTLLKELTVEIEKLKSELTATRQRNGVYLTHEAYEELRDESNSLKALVKEQREKIETIEWKLARKGRDLLDIMSNLDILNKDSEKTKALLENAKSLLENERTALLQTKRILDDEIFARRQHEHNEKQLTSLSNTLRTLLDQSSTAITNLHLKQQRQSELYTRNRKHYGIMQQNVVDTSLLIDSQLIDFQTEQQRLMDSLSARTRSFIDQELEKLSTSKSNLEGQDTAFSQLHQDAATHMIQEKDEMNKAIDEVRPLTHELKTTVGTGITELGTEMRRTLGVILQDIESLNAQLQGSHSLLSGEFGVMFDDMSKKIVEQRDELQCLRAQMLASNQQLERSQSQPFDALSEFVVKERALRDRENEEMMRHIQRMFEANVLQQQQRLEVVETSSAQLRIAGQTHTSAGALFSENSEKLLEQSRNLGDQATACKNRVGVRLDEDYATADRHTRCFSTAVSAAKDQITRFGEEHIRRLDTETQAIDRVVCRIQQQHSAQHVIQQRSLSDLALAVHDSYTRLGDSNAASISRLESLDDDFAEDVNKAQKALHHLDKDAHIRRQLAELSERVEGEVLEDYINTGETPSHDEHIRSRTTIDRLMTGCTEDKSPSPKHQSPTKIAVFADNYDVPRQQMESSRAAESSIQNDVLSLCERDPNISMNTILVEGNATGMGKLMPSAKGSSSKITLTSLPPLKRSSASSASAESNVPSKKRRS